MTTPIYDLTEWAAAQASPWVPHNISLRALEAAARGSVSDRDLTAPPGACVDGACYLVDTPATGAWAGHDGDMAVAVGANASNGWIFLTIATEGQLLWVEDEAIRLQYSEALSPMGWVELALGGIPDAPEDGLLYGRLDGAWEEITEGTGGGGGSEAYMGAHIVRGAAAVQVNASNNYVRLIYATETHDVGGWFDAATNNGRLVVPPGVDYVQVGGYVGVGSGDNAGDVQLAIRKNGVDVANNVVGDAFFRTVPIITPPLAVVPGDYFELWVRGNASQSWDGSNPFWIKALGVRGGISNMTGFEAGPPVKPETGDFAWVRQGTSTASNGTGALVLTPQADDTFRGFIKAAPVGNFTVYCRIEEVWNTTDATANPQSYKGIAIRNSAQTRVILFGLANFQSATRTAYRRLDFTGDGAVIPSSGTPRYLPYDPKWLRVAYDGVNLVASISPNGVDWFQIESVTIASFLTAAGGALDGIGIGARCPAAATPTQFFSHFSTTAPTLAGNSVVGNAFPASPATGQRFYRTDRKIEYVWDGARWLSTELFQIGVVDMGGSAVDQQRYVVIPYLGTYGLWLERLDAVSYKTGGDWDILFRWVNAADAATTIATADGGADAINTWSPKAVAIGAVLDANAKAFRFTHQINSGSGSAEFSATVHYRLIG